MAFREGAERSGRVRPAAERVRFARRVRLHQLEVDRVSGGPWLDAARGNRLDQPFDHLFPLQRLARGRGIAMPGAQGGAERRRIAHFQLKHPRLEHVGHDLQDLPVGRCSTGGVDRIDVHLHPARVTRDRHHLPFDDAAHVARGIIFAKPIAMDAARC